MVTGRTQELSFQYCLPVPSCPPIANNNDRKEGTWVFFDDSGVEVKRKNYRAGISDTAEEDELEESRYLDVLLSTVKKIPDPAVFADDPEGYMKLTGME